MHVYFPQTPADESDLHFAGNLYPTTEQMMSMTIHIRLIQLIELNYLRWGHKPADHSDAIELCLCWRQLHHIL